MGTSIAMLERHYFNLDVLHRAEALAGTYNQRSAKRGSKLRPRETKIIALEDQETASLPGSFLPSKGESIDP